MTGGVSSSGVFIVLMETYQLWIKHSACWETAELSLTANNAPPTMLPVQLVEKDTLHQI